MRKSLATPQGKKTTNQGRSAALRLGVWNLPSRLQRGPRACSQKAPIAAEARRSAEEAGRQDCLRRRCAVCAVLRLVAFLIGAFRLPLSLKHRFSPFAHNTQVRR